MMNMMKSIAFSRALRDAARKSNSQRQNSTPQSGTKIKRTEPRISAQPLVQH